jgi:hypothetical protein
VIIFSQYVAARKILDIVTQSPVIPGHRFVSQL